MADCAPDCPACRVVAGGPSYPHWESHVRVLAANVPPRSSGPQTAQDQLQEGAEEADLPSDLAV